MNVELINIGTELLQGMILNRHQQWLGRELHHLGFRLRRQLSIPDTAEAIADATWEALHRCPLVITTGGLGPTSDDITRESIARRFDVPLQECASVRDHIRKFFADRGRPMPESTAIQAMIPERAHLFMNANGTAPGLALQATGLAGIAATNEAPWLIMLPGPPRELQPMFLEQIVPFLHDHLPPPPKPQWRVVRSCGIGESSVQEAILNRLETPLQRGLEIGFYSRPGEVDVHFTSTGPTAAEDVATAVEITRRAIRPYIYSTDNSPIEAVVLRELIRRKAHLATAESCTGGHIANRITNIPGASAAFEAGFVTYSNAAKTRFLGVLESTLREYGAVSEPTAREMAAGARERTHADFALAVTGIAGPGGGTPDKPVGTVYLAVAQPGGIATSHFLLPMDRESFKYAVAQRGFDLLRRSLEGETPDDTSK